MITKETLTQMCDEAKDEKKEELEQLKDSLRFGNIQPFQYDEVKKDIIIKCDAKLYVLDQLAKKLDYENTPSLNRQRKTND